MSGSSERAAYEQKLEEPTPGRSRNRRWWLAATPVSALVLFLWWLLPPHRLARIRAHVKPVGPADQVVGPSKPLTSRWYLTPPTGGDLTLQPRLSESGLRKFKIWEFHKSVIVSVAPVTAPSSTLSLTN